MLKTAPFSLSGVSNGVVEMMLGNTEHFQNILPPQPLYGKEW